MPGRGLSSIGSCAVGAGVVGFVGWLVLVVVGGGGVVVAGVAAGVCLCPGRRRPETHQDVSQCHMSPREGRQVRLAGWR